jgi:hypothetical protein
LNSINSGSYEEKVYNYSYDSNTFLSDIGGYLGLLLGNSLLSFYDKIFAGIHRLYSNK